ncbi:MAG: hypothetical protein HQ485_09920 [Acidobacteria bacterium]|nr:hypothetical protein [Acidobacteriota bacterium]
MTAWLLRLHRLDTGRHAAWAVLCAEARYCSLAVPNVSTPVRRLLTGADWKVVAVELSLGLNACVQTYCEGLGGRGGGKPDRPICDGV